MQSFFNNNEDDERELTELTNTIFETLINDYERLSRYLSSTPDAMDSLRDTVYKLVKIASEQNKLLLQFPAVLAYFVYNFLKNIDLDRINDINDKLDNIRRMIQRKNLQGLSFSTIKQLLQHELQEKKFRHNRPNKGEKQQDKGEKQQEQQKQQEEQKQSGNKQGKKKQSGKGEKQQQKGGKEGEKQQEGKEGQESESEGSQGQQGQELGEESQEGNEQENEKQGQQGGEEGNQEEVQQGGEQGGEQQGGEGNQEEGEEGGEEEGELGGQQNGEEGEEQGSENEGQQGQELGEEEGQQNGEEGNEGEQGNVQEGHESEGGSENEGQNSEEQEGQNGEQGGEQENENEENQSGEESGEGQNGEQGEEGQKGNEQKNEGQSGNEGNEEEQQGEESQSGEEGGTQEGEGESGEQESEEGQEGEIEGNQEEGEEGGEQESENEGEQGEESEGEGEGEGQSGEEGNQGQSGEEGEEGGQQSESEENQGQNSEQESEGGEGQENEDILEELETNIDEESMILDQLEESLQKSLSALSIGKGSGGGVLKDINPRVLELLERANRVLALANQVDLEYANRGVKDQGGVMKGITTGNNIKHMFKSQLLLPDEIFLERYTNRALLQRAVENEGVGDFYFIIDKSGSMGDVMSNGYTAFENVSAVALASAMEAEKNNKKVFVQYFDNSTTEPLDVNNVFEIAQIQPGGGTDMMVALRQFMEYYNNYPGLKDIKQIFILSDFGTNYDNITLYDFKNFARNNGLVVTCIHVYNDEVPDEMQYIIDEICDEYYKFNNYDAGELFSAVYSKV